MCVANVYLAMIARCYNPKNDWYSRYGGRGIGVCDSWRNSAYNFIIDMGDQPEGMQLDRIDNDGDYSKENCRWVSARENSNNKSNNKILEIFGEKKTMANWSRDSRCKVAYTVLNGRVRMGWDLEDALSKPVRKEGKST
ncbi:hypothetical protein PBI_PEREGRIN_61 [Rhodococcus phage Peregrin]|nr:hypothetical protein PBI_PEREGRIN_61 [Rhodococcus phage Peregrin]